MIDGDNLSVPEMEIETLKSIYLNELDVQRDDCGAISSISIQLYPATADNVEEQYVTMYLSFKIPKEYPESIPDISIHNPRGLLDQQIDRITDNLFEIAENRKGSSMLFELIQAAKEQLTDENRPREDCAICLYGFFDEDVFMKTECYHYFHSHCLSRYIQCKIEEQKKEEAEQTANAEQNSESSSSNLVSCPVCRVPLSVDLAGKEFPEPVGVSGAVVDIDSSILDKQDEMDKIYKKQLQQGGIIDIEAESRKYLLEISNVPDDPVEETVVAKAHQSNVSVEAGSAVNGGTESGTRHRVSPNAISNRAASSNSQPRSAKNRRGKYIPRGRTSDWTECVEENHQRDGNSLEESDSQKPENESSAPRARKNYQNPRQNERFQRAPRFGGGRDGGYRNDNRYPRNVGYRRGNNNNRGGSRPYNRRTQLNDGANTVPIESEFNPNGATSAAHVEDAPNPNLSDVEDVKSAAKSNETGSRRKDSPQDHRSSSGDEKVNSRPNDYQRTSQHSSVSRDWSSRESPEKPAFQRYQKRGSNYRPRPQHSNERGRGRHNQNYSRDESRESAPLSPEAVSNANQNDKPQRYPENRSGYRNNGAYDNRQYGDRRRNPNWQPRHNDRGPRYNNYRNDGPRRGSYRNSQNPPQTNSASGEERKSQISNGCCSSHKENLPKDVPLQRDLSSQNVDSHSAELTFKVPHIENSTQDIDLKNSSCAAGANNLQSPPGFANPHKKVIYGLPSVNPPPGFHQS